MIDSISCVSIFKDILFSSLIRSCRLPIFTYTKLTSSRVSGTVISPNIRIGSSFKTLGGAA